MSNVAKRSMIAAMAFLVFAAGARNTTAGGPRNTDLDSLGHELEVASTSYDLELAESVFARVDDLDSQRSTAESLELCVRTALLVAELLRIEFEKLDRHERKERTAIGRRIDAAAGDALERIDGLPESSERWRMRADLVATQIRSDFRARKYRKEFESFSRRALELDEKNARAWVTAAKPFVFAGPTHGQDYEEAIRLLDRALELAPALEAALLLRGLAEERRGATDRALENWRAALRANPLCAPAEEGIARLEADGSGR
jgi:tetratricopeptide (TPR) repeat protein